MVHVDRRGALTPELQYRSLTSLMATYGPCALAFCFTVKSKSCPAAKFRLRGSGNTVSQVSSVFEIANAKIQNSDRLDRPST